MAKVIEREKNFAVHWISSRCWENFSGICFISIESFKKAIAQNIRWENYHHSLKICKNHKNFLSFNFDQYLALFMQFVFKILKLHNFRGLRCTAKLTKANI